MMTRNLCAALFALPLAAAPLFAQSTTGTAPTRTAPAPTSRTQQTPATTGSTATAPGEITPPAHPITVTQTREMFDLMGFQKLLNGNLTQMISMQKQSAPFVPEDVWTDLQTSFDKTDYVALFQPVYAKYLSQEDATKALEFYRTPAGRHVVETMPPLMHDIMVVAQQNGQKVGREVIDRHRPEIEAAQKKYQQEQQGGGAAPSLNGPSPSSPGSTSPRGSTTAPGASKAPSTTPKPPMQ